MSDIESSFVIEDSDDETSPQWTKKKNNNRKSDRFHKTIPDSENEDLDDEDEDEEEEEEEEEEGDENEDENDGRITPSIRKAIRRSIMNISRHMSQSDDDDDDDEYNDDGDEEEDEYVADQRSQIIEDSDSEEEIQPVKKHRVPCALIDSSDEESLPNKTTPRENSRKSRQKSVNGSRVSSHLDESEEESPLRAKNLSHSRKFVNVLDSSEDEQEAVDESKELKNHSEVLDETHEEDLDETSEEFQGLMNKPKNVSKNQHFNDLLDDTSEEAEEDLDSGRGSHPSFMRKNSAAARKSNEPNSRLSESLVFSDMSSEEHLPSRINSVQNIQATDSEDEIQAKKSQKKSNVLDSDGEIQEVRPTPKKTAEIISIESDDSIVNESHEKSEGELAAMSFAQEELGLNKIDPLAAQKRALIHFELKKAEDELSRLNKFLKEGQIQYLPDRGQRLIEKAQRKETEVADLKKQLAQLRLVEPNSPEVNREKFSRTQNPELTSPGHNKSDEYSPGSEAEEADEAINEPHTFNGTLLKRPTTKPLGEMGKQALETFQREQALTVETLKTFHGSLNSRPAENEQAEDPKGLKVDLLPHQKHALAWLLWRENQKPPGGVLADDMGLGKTLTMISLVLKVAEEKNSGDESEDEWYSKNKSSRHLGGTLVVCPASLIGQWEEEVKRRVKRGLLNVELYHGNKRENVPKRLARNDMVITTYNLVSREHKVRGVLYKVDWKRVILDEGHVIRNHKSQVCEAVCALVAKKRWVLTGTPIHNKEMDLFSILKFLECAPFNDIRVWKRWVDNKNLAGHERLAAVMKTLMLRRTKQELMAAGALDSLPEKCYEEILVNLDREERDVYEKVMLYSKTIFAQFLHQRAEKQHMFAMGAGAYDQPYIRRDNPFNKAQQKLLSQHADVKSHQILTLLLRLRQICIHPSLINAMLDQEDLETNGIEGMGAENDLTDSMKKMTIRNGYDDEVPDGPAEVSERVTQHLLTSDNPVFEKNRESSKLRKLIELLKKIIKTTNDKVIVVSQWTAALNIVAESLSHIKGATFKSLTGAIQVKDRGSLVDAFNNDKDPRILLLSLTAGGVGLNLVGANHLVLIDNHWNPQLESQAQDRIYRFGQKKNVFIYKLLCHDTIEERIKAMQEKKLELAKNVLSGSGKVTSSKLSLDELKSLFGM